MTSVPVKEINPKKAAVMARRADRMEERDARKEAKTAQHQELKKAPGPVGLPVRGPITQPGPMAGPRPGIPPRDIGLGNGPRGMGPRPTPMPGTGISVGVPGTDTYQATKPPMMKKGGKVKSTISYKSGGSVSSASKRGDGCAIKGKTKGRMV